MHISLVEDHAVILKPTSMRPPLSRPEPPEEAISSTISYVIAKRSELHLVVEVPKLKWILYLLWNTIKVCFDLRLHYSISLNLHICMRGHHHLAFSSILLLREWQFIVTECSSLLENYFSCLVLFINDLSKYNTHMTVCPSFDDYGISSCSSGLQKKGDNSVPAKEWFSSSPNPLKELWLSSKPQENNGKMGNSLDSFLL